MYNEHADALFRYFYFRLNDREQALDLTQTVFSRLWAYLSGGKEILHPKAFLYRSARYALINAIRDRKCTESLEALSERGFDIAAAEPDAAEIARQADAVARLASVEPRYREVLVLRYVNGLKIKEIAAMLGEKENTVSVRIRRGLAALKRLYEQESEHDE